MSNQNSFSTVEYYWVIPGRLRAGEYPGAITDDETRRRLQWFLMGGINLMIDLTEENEVGLRPYEMLFYEEALHYKKPVLYKRFPLQDFSIPLKSQVVEILDMIDLSLSVGKNIYLHCHGGKGRTGTIVGCYLVRQGMAGSDALERIKQLRQEFSRRNEHSPETVGQKRMVLEWKIGQ